MIFAAAFGAACHHASPGAPDASPDAATDAPVDAASIDAAPDAVPDAMADAQDCSAPITCPAPSTGMMTFCGQIADLGDSQPVLAPAVALNAYDAIALVSDPAGAPPLTTDEIVIDACGRFRVKNVQPASAQYIALAVADGGGSAYRTSASVFPTAAGPALTGVPLYAVSIASDAAWTTSAGLTGATLVDRGVLLGLFLHGATPVGGAKLTISGSTDATDDYYFGDASAASRTTIDPAVIATGVDGTSLMIGHAQNLAQYSGSGGEPSGCVWPTVLGDQIPGVAFVQPFVAVMSGNPTMTCP